MEIETKVLVNGFELVPRELVLHIISCMDIPELFMFSMTSRGFHLLTDDETIWKNAYIKDLPRTYCSLIQNPPPDYWKYKEYGSRNFAFLIKTYQRKLLQLYGTAPSESVIVMHVMKHFTLSRNLKLTGCYILRRLTYTPSECSVEYQEEMSSNRKMLGDNHVVPCLLGILQNAEESNDPVLIAAAICAINNIASDSNCKEIVEGLGIEIILECMNKYEDNIPILDYGSSALANIMREIQDEKVLSLILERSELALKLVNIPGTQPKNNISVLDLCTVLARQSTEFCVNEGGRVLSVIKDLLVKFSYDNDLLFTTCITIHEFCNLAVTNRKIALELGLAPILLDIISNLKDNNTLYGVLLALCFMFWENTDKYNDWFKRYVELSVTIMKENLKDKKLQLGIAVILGNYAANDPQHWEFINKFNITHLLTNAIKNFAEKEETYSDLLTILKLG